MISKTNKELKAVDHEEQVSADVLKINEQYGQTQDVERSFAEELAIEQGLVRVGNVAKLVQIDGHPFTGCINDLDGNLDSEILISQMAEKVEAILPELCISADDLKSNRRYEKEQNPERTIKKEVSVNNEELKGVDLEK